MTAFKMGFAFSVFVSVAFRQVPATLTVRGINGTTANFSAANLAKLPQQTVKTTDHGKPVTFGAVVLTDVLAKVALPTGDKFHSTAASYYLTVEGKDGYRAVFAWAELDSTFMDKAVYRSDDPGWQAAVGQGRSM